jgi:hypothetical protein
VKAVRRGTTLTPGKWYRITKIAPGDPEPSLAVGDVLLCSADPGPRELEADWHPEFGGQWFADLRPEEGGFGTLIAGLVEVPAPAVS